MPVVEKVDNATTHIIHTDHLGGTNVISDNDAEVSQVMDYYPYGSLRINYRSGSLEEKRKYIGEQYDAVTSLSYLNARYYDGGRGEFLSEDSTARDNPEKLLDDPQQLNSYSYARNNPIVIRDATGKYIEISLSGTYMGVSGATGLRVGGGVNVFISGGFGAGIAGHPFSISYTPGDVQNKTETMTTVGASAAFYVGGGVSSTSLN